MTRDQDDKRTEMSSRGRGLMLAGGTPAGSRPESCATLASGGLRDDRGAGAFETETENPGAGCAGSELPLPRRVHSFAGKILARSLRKKTRARNIARGVDLNFHRNADRARNRVPGGFRDRRNDPLSDPAVFIHS